MHQGCRSSKETRANRMTLQFLQLMCRMIRFVDTVTHPTPRFRPLFNISCQWLPCVPLVLYPMWTLFLEDKLSCALRSSFLYILPCFVRIWWNTWIATLRHQDVIALPKKYRRKLVIDPVRVDAKMSNILCLAAGSVCVLSCVCSPRPKKEIKAKRDWALPASSSVKTSGPSKKKKRFKFHLPGLSGRGKEARKLVELLRASLRDRGLWPFLTPYLNLVTVYLSLCSQFRIATAVLRAILMKAGSNGCRRWDKRF